MSGTWTCALCDFFSQSISFFFTIAVVNSFVEWDLVKYTCLEGGTQTERGSLSQVGIRSS